MKWGQGGVECVFFSKILQHPNDFLGIIHLRQVTSNCGEIGAMVVSFQE